MNNTINEHDESGYEKRARAGLIPFIRHPDSPIKYLMMVCSDPKFGGPRPMISKGKIESGETALQAAIREAEEELGLKQRNMRGDIIPLYAGRQELYSGAYDLTVFGVEIQDQCDFDKWCEETLYTEWHDLENFRKVGRKDHIKFVEALEKLVQEE